MRPAAARSWRPRWLSPCSRFVQLVEDEQIVAQVARHQKVRAHVLLAAAAEELAQGGVFEHVQRALGALLGARDQKPGDRVLDLQRYAEIGRASCRERVEIAGGAGA